MSPLQILPSALRRAHVAARRPSDDLSISLSLSLSLFLEQNKILLHYSALSHFGLILSFVLLLLTELLIVVLRGRAIVARTRRSRKMARRTAAILARRRRRSTAVTSAPSLTASGSQSVTSSPSLPVSDSPPHSRTASDPAPRGSVRSSFSEVVVAKRNEVEEELCSFTVIAPVFDVAFGSNYKMVGQPTMEKMKAYFMGLGVGSAVRFVDSPRFVFTISVPDCGLVLAHRFLFRFGPAIEDDEVFQHICLSFYDIGRQLYLSSASPCARMDSSESSSSGSESSSDAWTVTYSENSSSGSESSSSGTSQPSVHKKSVHKKAPRRSPRLAQKENRLVQKENRLVQKENRLVQKEKRTKENHRVEEAKPRRSSRLAQKAGKARAMK